MNAEEQNGGSMRNYKLTKASEDKSSKDLFRRSFDDVFVFILLLVITQDSDYLLSATETNPSHSDVLHHSSAD